MERTEFKDGKLQFKMNVVDEDMEKILEKNKEMIEQLGTQGIPNALIVTGTLMAMCSLARISCPLTIPYREVLHKMVDGYCDDVEKQMPNELIAEIQNSAQNELFKRIKDDLLKRSKDASTT